MRSARGGRLESFEEMHASAHRNHLPEPTRALEEGQCRGTCRTNEDIWTKLCKDWIRMRINYILLPST